jgi:hypothetical protein
VNLRHASFIPDSAVIAETVVMLNQWPLVIILIVAILGVLAYLEWRLREAGRY